MRSKVSFWELIEIIYYFHRNLGEIYEKVSYNIYDFVVITYFWLC